MEGSSSQSCQQKTIKMELNLTVKYVSVTPALTLPLCLTSSPGSGVTVKQLKEQAIEMGKELEISVPAVEFQRIIHKGRVLKDEMPLNHYGILDGENLVLLRVSPQTLQQKAQNEAKHEEKIASTFSTTGKNLAGGPGAFNPFAGQAGAGAGDRAFIEQMLRNPQVLEQAARENPQLANALRDPRMREMMNQPGFVDQLLAARGMNMPGAGGAGGLPRPPQAVPSAGAAAAGGGSSSASGAGPTNPAATAAELLNHPQMGQMMANAMNDPNTLRQLAAMDPQMGQMLQNPMMRQMLANPQMLQQMLNQQGQGQPQGTPMMPQQPPAAPGGGGLNFASLFGPPPAATTTTAPVAGPSTAQPRQPQTMQDFETIFAEQLRQLQDMGFYDKQAGIMALQATGGNVEAAIEHMLGDM